MVNNRVISCEHGGNELPVRFQPFFRNAQAALNSHRGWDMGSSNVALRMADAWHCPIHTQTTTRLLIDCNRSIGHARLFSQWSKPLLQPEKDDCLESIYHPYRNALMRDIRTTIASSGQCIHLSVHSFTPVLDGQERKTDIGILYDPARKKEQSLATAWQEKIKKCVPAWSVHRNSPYRGISDGFCTAIRKEFPPDQYLGLELEINQKHSTDNRTLMRIADVLIETFPQV